MDQLCSVLWAAFVTWARSSIRNETAIRMSHVTGNGADGTVPSPAEPLTLQPA
jgi:hypothetical protein